VDERDLSKAEIPQSIEARKIVKVVALSFAEAERAFSLMNDIATDKRNSLVVENISRLMTVKLIGKPLAEWDATPYVKSWLHLGHHTAVDN
jgi:hypothetical protein